MTNSNERLDQMETVLTAIQVTRSNARAIEALSADAANRADIATTRASVDGLVQTIAEFSIRSEARLNRLDDAVIGIERILAQLLRRNQNGNSDQPQS